MATRCWYYSALPAVEGLEADAKIAASEADIRETAICTAPMVEAGVIIYVAANAYLLADDNYITDLCEFVQYLSPDIAFSENIDFRVRH